MKYLIIISFVSFIIAGCSSGSGSEKTTKKTEITTTKTYSLFTDKSTLTWNRQVDYKHLEKRVKVFGAYADVTMDNVQFETNGDAVLNNGSIVLVNDEYQTAELEIDLSLTRFYSDEEEEFFVSEEYPPAKLVIKSFKPVEGEKDSYTAECDLTINEVTKAVTFPVTMSKSEKDIISIHATYLMQTSEWPILKQPKPENVNYDEISFGFDLVFGNMAEKSDTAYID